MPRQKRSSLQREIDQWPLEEILQRAVTGVGLAWGLGRVYADQLECLVVLAVGPAAEALRETVDQAVASVTAQPEQPQQDGETDERQ